MNKEVIKKYRKEFDHWLDGGKLAFKYKAKEKSDWGWITDAQATFCGLYEDKYLIVINDEYIEFRKALAEGKTIHVQDDSRNEHYCNGHQGYLTNSPHFSKDVSMYSIKPDEPFKVGDYVVRLKDSTWITLLSEKDLNAYNGVKGYHDLGKEVKLWTLEEADDDELVYRKCDNVCSSNIKGYYKQVTILKAKVAKKDSHNTYKPYIGQTPAQLGLEK